MRLNKRQRKILEKLTFRMEKRTDEKRRISLKASQLWKGYDDDFSDVNEVEEFETDIEELEKSGLISVERAHGRIVRVREVPGRLPDYYSLTGIVPKDKRIDSELDIYKKYRDCADLCRFFCDAQEKLILSGKKAMYSKDRGEDICRLLKTVSENEAQGREMLERELSVTALGDSKAFERKYRTALCKIIAEAESLEKSTGREWEKDVLERHGVTANPSYVYIKGNITLKGEDGRMMKLIPGVPAAVSSAFLSDLDEVNTEDDIVMTVENLTTFHRIEETGRLYIYTGGYHSIILKQLLQKIDKDNQIKKWLHFGDIDPDGFYILTKLRDATGLPIEPFLMDAATLLKYKDSARPLTEGDRVKCMSLYENREFADVAECMLEYGIKLEQEIIDK